MSQEENNTQLVKNLLQNKHIFKLLSDSNNNNSTSTSTILSPSNQEREEEINQKDDYQQSNCLNLSQYNNNNQTLGIYNFNNKNNNLDSQYLTPLHNNQDQDDQQVIENEIPFINLQQNEKQQIIDHNDHQLYTNNRYTFLSNTISYNINTSFTNLDKFYLVPILNFNNHQDKTDFHNLEKRIYLNIDLQIFIKSLYDNLNIYHLLHWSIIKSSSDQVKENEFYFSKINDNHSQIPYSDNKDLIYSSFDFIKSNSDSKSKTVNLILDNTTTLDNKITSNHQLLLLVSVKNDQIEAIEHEKNVTDITNLHYLKSTIYFIGHVSYQFN